VVVVVLVSSSGSTTFRTLFVIESTVWYAQMSAALVAEEYPFSL